MNRQTKSKQPKKQTRPSGAAKPAKQPVKPRTTSTIINALARKPANAPHAHSYISCRLDPFRGDGRTAIPDGSNSNYVVTDSFASDRISVSTAGASFTIQTSTTLPALALVNSLDAITVNGVSISASAALLPSATANRQWVPICVPSAFQAIDVKPGQGVTDPFQCSGWRIVTIGFRIVYTGPVNTCAGSITVTPNNVTYSPQNMTTAAGVVLKAWGPAGTDLGAYSNNTPLLAADVSNSSTAMTRASRTFRPEQPITLLSRHSGTTYRVTPTAATPYGVIANSPVSTSPSADFYNYGRQLAGNSANGVLSYDNDWSGFQICFNNLNADASFRIESVVCLEVNPGVTSPFYPLTSRTSPSDKTAIEAAERAVAQLSIR